jgi:hypothetical protein
MEGGDGDELVPALAAVHWAAARQPAVRIFGW